MLAFDLDEAARITVDLVRRRGRREALVDSRVLSGHVGFNEVTLRAGLRPRAPGRYALHLVAADAQGNRSRPKVARFTVRAVRP